MRSGDGWRIDEFGRFHWCAVVCRGSCPEGLMERNVLGRDMGKTPATTTDTTRFTILSPWLCGFRLALDSISRTIQYSRILLEKGRKGVAQIDVVETV
jgi:hypothetical protein